MQLFRQNPLLKSNGFQVMFLNVVLGWLKLNVPELFILELQKLVSTSNGVGDLLMKELVELSEMNGFWTL